MNSLSSALVSTAMDRETAQKLLMLNDLSSESDSDDADDLHLSLVLSKIKSPTSGYRYSFKEKIVP